MMPPPAPPTPTPPPNPPYPKERKQRHKQLKKKNIQNVPKTQKVARLPAKMQYDFFARSENIAPATQNGRAQIHWWPQIKMHFCCTKKKNAFRLHEEQNLNVTNDNFGDGETVVLRVYRVYIYIFIYTFILCTVYI